MNIKIRDANPSDQAIVAAYNSNLAEETEARTLDPQKIGPGVAALLSDTSKGRYWIAEIDGNAVGQILVTYEWSDWRNGMLWWIQSVYVVAEFRRHGVFTALYRHVESLAKEDQNACGIRLYVERNNTRAQSTYNNLGMSEPGYLVMQSLF